MGEGCKDVLAMLAMMEEGRQRALSPGSCDAVGDECRACGRGEGLGLS